MHSFQRVGSFKDWNMTKAVSLVMVDWVSSVSVSFENLLLIPVH